jgi:hypothetical protein
VRRRLARETGAFDRLVEQGVEGQVVASLKRDTDRAQLAAQKGGQLFPPEGSPSVARTQSEESCSSSVQIGPIRVLAGHWAIGEELESTT